MTINAPITGVKYRIQSVDISDKCLELLNPSSSATVVKLRPLKETNSQYWQFLQVSGTTYYYVQNVESTDRYLNYSSSGLVAGSNTSSYSYTTPSHQSDNVYRLVINNNTYYLTTDESSAVSLPSTLSSINPNSQKWQIIPVTVHPVNNQELKSGDYRIRNINGRNLLTMPSQNSVGDNGVYAGSQLEKDDEIAYQRWTVTSQSSGDYIIQNTGTNTYLGCSATSAVTAVAGDGLVGLTSVFNWNLQSLGGFSWSLRVPATELSIGVANYDIEDNDEVSLVPSDATSSQIWFIEKYHALGEDNIHAKREIKEGRYHLQCVHDQTIYMVAYASPLRITAKTITDPTKVSTDASKFELKYIDKDSAHFKLTQVTTNSPAPVVADRGGYLGMNSTGTEFVLLEKNRDDPGYFICRPELGRPHKVVSNRTKLDDDGNTVFAIDNMTPGEALQMWKFVSAS